MILLLYVILFIQDYLAQKLIILKCQLCFIIAVIIIVIAVLILAGISTTVVMMNKHTVRDDSFIDDTSEEKIDDKEIVEINKNDDTKETVKEGKQISTLKEEDKKEAAALQTDNEKKQKDVKNDSKKEINNSTTEQLTTEASKPSEMKVQQPEAEEPKHSETKIQQTVETPKPAITDNTNNQTEEKVNPTVESTTEKEKIWHEPVYEQVWVVDTPAWDEDVVEYHDICNQCGCNITTGGWVAHCKASADEEGYEHCFSYSTDVPVVVNTIHHDEKGHYEQKLITEGYWE